MRKRKLEELLRIVEENDIQELVIPTLLGTVRIVRAGQTPASELPAPVKVAMEPAHAGRAMPAVSEEAQPLSGQDRDSGLVPIESPMVGTFYTAISPESPPYVRQGDRVNRGQVVCIVEAMKLMNEIESEVSGTIVRVLAENAQPVEYGQTMFLVEPD